MRPTFLGMETARRGLQVFQKGIDITGQNMTNVNTPGYTRQRVDVVSVASGAVGSRYGAGTKISLAGQGAKIVGIGQVRDSFLDKRFREEYTDVGYYEKASSIIEDVEAALDEVGGKGLGYAIEDLWTSLKSLQENLDQGTNANIVMTSAKNMTQLLKQFNDKLNDISDQQKYNLSLDVNDVNSLLENIANLNHTIKSDIILSGDAGNYGPNELLDQRNLLLDELSVYGNMKITTNDDGTVDVEMNGHNVVKGDKHEIMNYVDHPDGTTTLSWMSNGEEVHLTSGSLKASLDMINGRGSNAQKTNERFEKGVPYYRDKIDAFAIAISNVFNNTIMGSDGQYKTLFESSDPYTINAGNIQLSNQWATDPSYIIKDIDVGDGYDNPYIAKLITMFDEKINFPAPGEVLGEFTGTFNEYVTFYNGTIGQEMKFNSDRYTATASIADDLLSRRDAVMGIQPDEEGANMMVYQKAYSACARLMTALDEALDVLINNTGLVGR